MPYTKTTYYLGTRYDVTTRYDPGSRYDPRPRVLWRNVRITRDGEVTGQDFSELDLSGLWGTFQRRMYRARSPLINIGQEFLAYLRTLVSDPETVDDLAFCGECNEPVWRDGLQSGICQPCIDEYYSSCDHCEELVRSDETTGTLGEQYVCSSCRGRYYTYCEYCDGYYPDDYAYEHDHESGSGCCESPAMQFTVRNDGTDPLANDTRASFTLPAGTISPAGLAALRGYIYNAGHHDLAYGFTALGDQWQTRDGNFAKRLSRHAYKHYGIKLTPEIMSQVGCIARDHSKAVSVEIEVTRDFNQSAEYFYHEDSCYWGGYSEGRCVLKTNGGFALRSFDQYGSVSGRAWVMPMRLDEHEQLTPTFNTMSPAAFVVTNGYGDLGGYAPARIMAHMAGWTYRKIGYECVPMYINAGGYLIAPEELAAQYTDKSLHLSVNQHSSLYESERTMSNAA